MDRDEALLTAGVVADGTASLTGTFGSWSIGDRPEDRRALIDATAEARALRFVLERTTRTPDPSLDRIAVDLVGSLQERARTAMADGLLSSKPASTILDVPPLGDALTSDAPAPRIHDSQFRAAVAAGEAAFADTEVMGRLPVPETETGRSAFGAVSLLGSVMAVLSERARLENDMAPDYRAATVSAGIELSRTLRRAQPDLRVDLMTMPIVYTAMYEGMMSRPTEQELAARPLSERTVDQERHDGSFVSWTPVDGERRVESVSGIGDPYVAFLKEAPGVSDVAETTGSGFRHSVEGVGRTSWRIFDSSDDRDMAARSALSGILRDLDEGRAPEGMSASDSWRNGSLNLGYVAKAAYDALNLTEDSEADHGRPVADSTVLHAVLKPHLDSIRSAAAGTRVETILDERFADFDKGGMDRSVVVFGLMDVAMKANQEARWAEMAETRSVGALVGQAESIGRRDLPVSARGPERTQEVMTSMRDASIGR